MRGSREFAMAMMLITSFGASVGGIGTPVGTPPNLIGIGMLSRIAGVQISFFQWMLLGVPIVVAAVRVPGRLLSTARSLRGLTLDMSAAPNWFARSCGGSVRCRPAQRNVLVAFGVTVVLWLLPGVLAICGLGDTAFAQAIRRGGARVGRGDGRRDAAVRAAGELARAPVHADVGGGGPDRLGHHPALRRRAGDGGAGVLDRLAEAMGRGITSWLPGARRSR